MQQSRRAYAEMGARGWIERGIENVECLRCARVFWRAVGQSAEDFYGLWRGGKGLEGTLDGAEVTHFMQFMVRGRHALGMELDGEEPSPVSRRECGCVIDSKKCFSAQLKIIACVIVVSIF